MMIGKEDRPPITGAPSNARREARGKCEFPGVAPSDRKSEPMANKFIQTSGAPFSLQTYLYHHSVDLACAFHIAHTEPVQAEAFPGYSFHRLPGMEGTGGGLIATVWVCGSRIRPGRLPPNLSEFVIWHFTPAPLHRAGSVSPISQRKRSDLHSLFSCLYRRTCGTALASAFQKIDSIIFALKGRAVEVLECNEKAQERHLAGLRGTIPQPTSLPRQSGLHNVPRHAGPVFN